MTRELLFAVVEGERQTRYDSWIQERTEDVLQERAPMKAVKELYTRILTDRPFVEDIDTYVQRQFMEVFGETKGNPFPERIEYTTRVLVRELVEIHRFTTFGANQLREPTLAQEQMIRDGLDALLATKRALFIDKLFSSVEALREIREVRWYDPESKNYLN